LAGGTRGGGTAGGTFHRVGVGGRVGDKKSPNPAWEAFLTSGQRDKKKGGRGGGFHPGQANSLQSRWDQQPPPTPPGRDTKKKHFYGTSGTPGGKKKNNNQKKQTVSFPWWLGGDETKQKKTGGGGPPRENRWDGSVGVGGGGPFDRENPVWHPGGAYDFTPQPAAEAGAGPGGGGGQLETCGTQHRGGGELLTVWVGQGRVQAQKTRV